MTEQSNFLVEHNEHVTTVWLNRPNKRNAMTDSFFRELGRLFHELDRDQNVRVIILAGKGKSFSAGLDLTSLSTMPSMDLMDQTPRNRMDLLGVVKDWQDGISAVERCRKPVIAAVHGACIGGGLDLIAACDIRLASSDAYFSLREAAIAIAADLGSLQRLPHIIGQGWTREMAFTAGDYSASQALDMKLLNRVLDSQEDLFAAANELAERIAGQSPLAVQSSKEALNFSRNKSVEDGLHYAVLRNSMILPSGELMEAFQAFMEKRSPKF